MSDTQNKSIARFLPVVGRVVFGLAMLAFGLMNLFMPMQTPPEVSEPARAFSAALAATGYMMPMIGILLSVCGALLLANRYVPLALLLLAPFFVNSVLFHVFLERTGLVPSLVFFALELALAWSYRGVFAHVLRGKNPTGG
jgi:putative oxidoreductase